MYSLGYANLWVSMAALTDAEQAALADYYAAIAAQESAGSEAAAAANARAQALTQLHNLGWSYRQIASEVGLTRARVQQLVERGNNADSR